MLKLKPAVQSSLYSFHLKGWRAVWVSYQEAIVTKNRDINVMKITAPTTQAAIHPLYFDLLRFASEVRRQSRDKVVPPIDPNLYSNNNFWQQTYRWSQVCLNMFVLKYI